jgi:hypothetical protein
VLGLLKHPNPCLPPSKRNDVFNWSPELLCGTAEEFVEKAGDGRDDRRDRSAGSTFGRSFDDFGGLFV